MTKRFATARPSGVSRRSAVSGLVSFAALAAVGVLGSEAKAKQARPAPSKEATAPRQAGEPIMAIVSIKSQQVTLYDAEGWILRAPVSTGTTGRETPAGIFAVVDKEKDHHSTMYDDAWMPNMQRITWNGIALHGGPLPGYAASHGCVRMPYGFAERLFDKTRIGMRVIISPNDAAPVDFSHPALAAFVPNKDALAATPARAETLSREAAEAARAADEAKKAATAATKDAASVTASLRKLEQHKARADAEVALAEKRLAAAKTDQARQRAEEQKTKAAAKAAEAAAQLDTAKADTKTKPEAAAAAKEAAKAADAKKAETGKAALDARLALEPFSIYISRDTRKLYVRRNTHKPAPDGGGEVFDTSIEVPVTIRNPEKPLGTHVFTAVARTDSGLRWTAVTIDEGDEATNALDRITIPREILDRIAATASPRSSIVISDEPLSAETNYRTEFVTVLSNHPQGGFITRKPSTDVLIADEGSYNSGFGSLFGGWGRQDGYSYQQRELDYQRRGRSQPAPQQRGWDSQPTGPWGWGSRNGYYRRDDQGW